MEPSPRPVSAADAREFAQARPRTPETQEKTRFEPHRHHERTPPGRTLIAGASIATLLAVSGRSLAIDKNWNTGNGRWATAANS